MKQMQINLPRLNGLKPTLESTALKLMEEAGELAQAIGKHRGMSGESGYGLVMLEPNPYPAIARELLDVAQTAVTMMFVLEEKYQIDLSQVLKEHLEKLRRKGYLVDATRAGQGS